eukprot:GHRQ01028479.1.p1 GENE.GHRQ01028479.1~~GHRQ01028479.1.p1  ORF type:complete len:129 (+),score=16.87 GHRQ01028479.1:349-735(+)
MVATLVPLFASAPCSWRIRWLSAWYCRYMQGKVAPGALAVPACPAGPNGILCTPKSARFRVYDLVGDAPPKNIHEAAERGDTHYIVKAIERTIDFDINMIVSKRLQHQHDLAAFTHQAQQQYILLLCR